ncbi:hypothetical protein [Gimesia sp.]|uniref:hypothetical protein n=1 Tax=Gimesia sp. TaxID=2024833 RepID=UPI003A94DEB2
MKWFIGNEKANIAPEAMRGEGTGSSRAVSANGRPVGRIMTIADADGDSMHADS